MPPSVYLNQNAVALQKVAHLNGFKTQVDATRGEDRRLTATVSLDGYSLSPRCCNATEWSIYSSNLHVYDQYQALEDIGRIHAKILEWEMFSCYVDLNKLFFLHFEDNSLLPLDTSDRLFKVKKVIESIKGNMRLIPILSPDLSMDEQIVPYKGKSWRFKFFCLEWASGPVVLARFRDILWVN